MRSEIIEKRLRSILSRLSPPRSIANNAEAQKSEAAAMLKALSASCPTRGVDDWLDSFEEALFSALETRAWPTLREVKKACRVKISSSGATSDVEIALKWFNTFNKPHPVLNNPQITAEILSRGMVEDIREARWRGLDLTTEDRDRARYMRPVKDEWHRHVSVMAALRGQSLDDCERQEAAELSPGQLPEKLALKWGA